MELFPHQQSVGISRIPQTKIADEVWCSGDCYKSLEVIVAIADNQILDEPPTNYHNK